MPGTSPQEAQGAARVMIVDDHPVVVEGLSLVLNAHPELTVCGTANSAAETLRLLPVYDPRIVVLDMSLLDSSGLDVLDRMRPEEGRIVVVYSQFDNNELRKAATAHGASAFVPKSVRGDELATILVTLSREGALQRATSR